MATKLLFVDDDSDLGVMLRSFFEESGIGLEIETNGVQGMARLEAGTFDLVVLDLMLPGLNGFDVLSQLRRRFRIPVIILSARSGRADRVHAFDFGADDYLTKPFYPEELLARVKAILRRSAPHSASSSDVLHEGELALFPGRRQAYYQGKQLNLTAMECEILEQLLRSSGRAVSRDQLSLHLYSRVSSPYDRTIDTHVSRIRRKLGEHGRKLITSVRGTGYQLLDLRNSTYEGVGPSLD